MRRWRLPRLIRSVGESVSASAASRAFAASPSRPADSSAAPRLLSADGSRPPVSRVANLSSEAAASWSPSLRRTRPRLIYAPALRGLSVIADPSAATAAGDSPSSRSALPMFEYALARLGARAMAWPAGGHRCAQRDALRAREGTCMAVEACRARRWERLGASGRTPLQPPRSLVRTMCRHGLSVLAERLVGVAHVVVSSRVGWVESQRCIKTLERCVARSVHRAGLLVGLGEWSMAAHRESVERARERRTCRSLSGSATRLRGRRFTNYPRCTHLLARGPAP